MFYIPIKVKQTAMFEMIPVFETMYNNEHS